MTKISAFGRRRIAICSHFNEPIIVNGIGQSLTDQLIIEGFNLVVDNNGSHFFKVGLLHYNIVQRL